MTGLGWAAADHPLGWVVQGPARKMHTHQITHPAHNVPTRCAPVASHAPYQHDHSRTLPLTWKMWMPHTQQQVVEHSACAVLTPRRTHTPLRHISAYTQPASSG
jgi:hypothetical protein